MSDPQTLPFPYGVNQFTTLPWSFEDDVRNYARRGVQAIELCEIKLDDARRDEQLALLADSGLTVSSVQPKVRTVVASAGQPEPKGREDRLTDIERSIRELAPHAPGAAFVTNTGPPPGNGNIADAIAQTVADHRRLAAVATDSGVRIALEPLSPVSMNQETSIWTFRQALHVVSEVGRDELGICVDLWNLWQDGDLVSDLQSAPDRVFLLQVSDWRTPRSGMDRRSVGTGEIPTGRLLHAVYDAGYRGPCVVEIFSQNVPDSLYDGDLDALVRDNRTALEQAWRTG
ncbi:sugar phosphate isomerase/epimerase [Blastococcus sp. TF02A-30]|uniref:sugar phosphate isomerase/epimerase family protein n=1 Tax=Blastococcus sp. TF02A-30 TaxID=2250580 RepID=UPI000DEA7A31|nr:sugar phosphate isomerase/epimerase family protein [Blastococcus sp. TF02A-30]RBY92881.1 sugar phosphate isomerase/epimerase [Blastococcus sp. TF02A-30]